jgi:hypothetical protein
MSWARFEPTIPLSKTSRPHTQDRAVTEYWNLFVLSIWQYRSVSVKYRMFHLKGNSHYNSVGSFGDTDRSVTRQTNCVLVFIC